MTIRELAGEIGVSPATISMVLNGKGDISEQTRVKVLEAVEKYGYSPKRRKAVLRNRILLIQYRGSGYLVEENQGFISAIIDAIEKNLKNEDYGLSIVNISGSLREELEAMNYEGYSGAILIASEIPQSMYGDIASIRIPFIVIDNPVPNYNYPCLCMNNEENVWIALNFLKQRGFYKIGLLTSSIPFENFEIRNRGFFRSLESLGFSFWGPEHRLRPDMKGARADMLRDLDACGTKELPECFFAVNDIIALGAITALRERGVRVPEEVSVIGFDDIPYAAVSSPTLTTIHVQRRFIGYEAVRGILNRIENPQLDPVKTLVTGKLVERRSVRN